MPLGNLLCRELRRGTDLELQLDNLSRMNDVLDLFYVFSLISPNG